MISQSVSLGDCLWRISRHQAIITDDSLSFHSLPIQTLATQINIHLALLLLLEIVRLLGAKHQLILEIERFYTEK
ncbi:MAG: hypothetical protein MHMPM18_001952 [Marteilia pararefringens]